MTLTVAVAVPCYIPSCCPGCSKTGTLSCCADEKNRKILITAEGIYILYFANIYISSYFSTFNRPL